jgi:DNA (cytosine-5)-methyltransferase 1
VPTVAALFAGIGGIERGLARSGFETEYLCEWWEPAQRVLRRRFPDVPLVRDIRDIRTLPRVDLVTGGFPCTDLSQAGLTKGIDGDQSGLVRKALSLVEDHPAQWLLLENVRNMLHLHQGRAMAAVTSQLDAMGFRWAYRVVDSRFTGVPQRRQRVILLASRIEDPRSVLFADDAGPRDEARLAEDAFGFYWTEGLRGLGWCRDGVPTLKGGSTVGIPSPPAVWLPNAAAGFKFVTPAIETAERLQGFRAGATAAAAISGRRGGPRWKLAGNAVTVGVAAWIGRRLVDPGQWDHTIQGARVTQSSWPLAAWGENGKAWTVEVSMWPERHCYRHLRTMMGTDYAPLSSKGAGGFLSRLERSNLSTPHQFRIDLKEHVDHRPVAP